MGVTTSSTVAATYEPIATTTLASATATVTLGTGGTISQAYTDLILVMNLGQTNVTEGFAYIRVGNNSVDSNSNYSSTILFSNTNNTSAGRLTNQTRFTDSRPIYGAPNLFIINFMNYSNTTTYKGILFKWGNPNSGLDVQSQLWRSTSAINIINITADASTVSFSSGSTFTLYGIKAA